MKAIGIDIGGTKIGIGVVREDGVFLKKEEISTNPHMNGESILSRIAERLRQFREEEIAGIGIGTAGQISPRGVVLSSTDTFSDWKGINVKRQMEEATGCRVEVVNDVQAMGLGEQRFGAGKNVNDFICVALGTGVGGSIITNGKLVRGHLGAAGELGHMILIPEGRRCPCGNRGCLEAHVSGVAIESLYQERYSVAKKGQLIFKEALENDPHALAVVEHYLMDLTTGLTSLVNIFNPEKVILGGGVAQSLLPYMERLTYDVRRYVAPVNDKVSIEQSRLRGDAMILGAASLVM
ncbi:glucokinase [Kroppenstedtia sanguinis]|uniref:ROK family protein n=1 Tax=Kroppenstedtia sanguinis TaxID=1380684 RepID=A0ABW4CA16_9BACL